MAKARSIIYAMGIITLIFSLMGAIFAGKAATAAADTTNASSARGWAIGATTVSSFNILVAIAVMGFVAYHSRKSD